MKKNQNFTYEQKRDYYSKRALDKKLDKSKQDFAFGFVMGSIDAENDLTSLDKAVIERVKTNIAKNVCTDSVYSKGYIKGIQSVVKSGIVKKIRKNEIAFKKRFASHFKKEDEQYRAFMAESRQQKNSQK